MTRESATWVLAMRFCNSYGAWATYVVVLVLRVAVVQQALGEESDGVVGLVAEGLRESLAEDEGDALLLEIGDVGVLAAEQFIEASRVGH